MPMMIINKDEIAHMSKNGGNALGLKEDDGPLIRKIVSLYINLIH
jgi:hypothetical protein